MLHIKRVYENASKTDGYRILVDRLWPRGISKETANIDLWIKDIAPSTQLRKWFDHDPKKWNEFQKKYRQELADNPMVDSLREIIKQYSNVTLVYSAKDTEHNQAKVIQEYLV